MGYSPWGHKKSDMTEATEQHICTQNKKVCLHEHIQIKGYIYVCVCVYVYVYVYQAYETVLDKHIKGKGNEDWK